MSDALNRITAMAELLTQADIKVDKLEEELKAAKAARLKLEREELPDLMRELEITQIRLDNGASVQVADDFACSISEDRREAAHGWLKVNGFDGLIRTILSVSFGREERELTTEVRDTLTVAFPDLLPEIKESVHASTLKAFIKDEREKGKSPPEDVFGIFPYSVAKITQPKVKDKK